MLNENLISTLEQSLQQTRNRQNRLVSRLRELDAEAEGLRQEISSLETNAAQTEQAIYGLLTSLRGGVNAWNSTPNPPQNNYQNDDYDQDYRINPRGGANQQRFNNNSNNGNNNNQGLYNHNNLNVNNPRNIPIVNSRIEPLSQRFSDRTITQACTLLLRESGSPMHVNELYNMLRSGGMQFSGNNPTISIAVSLNRNRRFKKVAPGTFDLVVRDASMVG
jgi:HB1, ASXL, restriction endonuclease HTH domain